MKLITLFFLLFSSTQIVGKNFDSKFLARELENKAKQGKTTPEKKKIMDDATKALRQSNILSKAKKIGDQAPDFTLKDAQGAYKKLTDFLKQGPVILTFYRGGWCPYCNLQLRAYQKVLSEFKKHGATLIAISPELPDNTLSTKSKNALEFEVLSDPQNQVGKAYGLVFKAPKSLVDLYQKFGIDLEKNQGNKNSELPIPATYVISKQGKIIYSFLNIDYKKRAEPSDIIKALSVPRG